MDRGRWFTFADRFTEYCFYLLIVAVPISIAAIEIFAGLILLGFIAKKCLKPDFRFVRNSAFLLLLGFLFFSALSLCNSGSLILKSITALSLKWLKYIGIFFFAQDVFSQKKKQENAAMLLLLVSGMVALDGISQWILGIDFLRHKPLSKVKNDIYAVSASFNHYNGFGAYLICVLSLGVASVIDPIRRIGSKILPFVLVLSLGLCLFLTLSRGSWLGLFCAILLMFILLRCFRSIIVLLVFFIVILLFFPGLKERVASTFEPGGTSRLDIWKIAWNMITKNPFLGNGIGTFMDRYSLYNKTNNPQYAHNCYLQIWAETGIFSLLSFLLFVGTILYRGVKGFQKSRNFILLGLVCGLFGFLVHSFFDTQLYSLQLATLFWIILGLTVAITRLELSGEK